MTNLIITAAHNYTAVGHGAIMTASSVRAGLSRLFTNDNYLDHGENPVVVAMIQGIDNGPDVTERIVKAVCMSLDELLKSYFRDSSEPFPPVYLLLGVPSEERPGPRFGDACLSDSLEIIEQWTPCASTHILPYGNASFMHAVEQAKTIIAGMPDAICIIGGIDSLLDISTLNWFEKDSRLMSETYGRHHGLIPGEAVGFVIVEDVRHAVRTDGPVLARIAGTGVSVEPNPRATDSSSRAVGLTEACRAALDGVNTAEVSTVFTDLNGENARAYEWGVAELRCFKDGDPSRQPWQPYESYGDIGAASGVVSAAVAARGLTRGWLKGKVLITCSDDHGPCGATVLQRYDQDNP